MCRVFDVMLLQEGYRTLCKTAYKPVEECQKTAEIREGSLKKNYPRPLNQAEYENLLQREKTNPEGFPFDQIDFHYLTKKFRLEKIQVVDKVSKYLLTILNLAEDTLKRLADNACGIKQLKNSEIKEDDRKYQIIKNSINCFIDIYRNIRISRKSICNPESTVMAGKHFDKLESDFNLILNLSPVPDEVVVNIGETISGVSLIRFSEQKKAGMSDRVLIDNADNTCTRFFSVILNFVHGLIDEFSYYMCPEEFINNPTCSALFLIPDDMYTSFNFSQGGLCKFEMQPLDTDLNYKKSVFTNTLKFYQEVRSFLETALYIAKEKTKQVKLQPDDNVFETFLEKYKRNYLNSTEGNIKEIEEMISASAGFREKVTALLVIMNPAMLAALDKNEIPWGIERKEGESI
ncbi:MAG: hypothetical protein HUK25_07950, partial [Treponema sp.]|nr:hypothetical protein [Treponema sp.]